MDASARSSSTKLPLIDQRRDPEVDFDREMVLTLVANTKSFIERTPSRGARHFGQCVNVVVSGTRGSLHRAAVMGRKVP